MITEEEEKEIKTSLRDIELFMAEELKPLIKEHNKMSEDIYGNGKPGLKADVKDLKSSLDSLLNAGKLSFKSVLKTILVFLPICAFLASIIWGILQYSAPKYIKDIVIEVLNERSNQLTFK